MNNRTTAIEVERLYREAERFHVKLDGLKENTQCAPRVNYNGSDIDVIGDAYGRASLSAIGGLLS